MGTLAQVLANGLVTGSIYLLVAVAFLLAFRSRRFFDFSFAALIVVGPYSAMALLSIGFPLWLGGPLGCCITASACLGLQRLVFDPLERHQASPLEQLLASLGVYVVLQNAISLAFGDYARNLSSAAAETFEILGARVTYPQAVTMAIAASVALGLDQAARRTTFGLSIRAVGEDRELAAVLGVSVRWTTLVALGLAGLLVGLAGTGLALDVAIAPTTGLKPLLGGIVAVVVSGARTVRAAAWVAVGLGLLEHCSVLAIGSLWKDAVVFVVLLVVLLVRPRGIQAVTERAG